VLKGRVLIVEDEATVRFAIRTYLETYGYEIEEAESCATALTRVNTMLPDVLLIDYALPDGTALDLMGQLKAASIEVPVVLITGHGSIELAVTAIKEGAEHFLTKPLELASLAVVIDRIIENQQNKRRVSATRRPAATLDLFSGRSAAIHALARDAYSAAQCDLPILIQGETGTGKGMLARWIHAESRRASESFVDLNCAGLPRDLLESELFGHEKGAFTGAVAAKPGLLEAAHRGTMFLDEIGDTDVSIQPKLLKVVEEKRFRRLGEVGERRVDVRFLAATNRELSQLVDEGRFREDLYYRINTLVLRLPPLRHRKADIPGLATSLVQHLAREMGRPPLPIDPDAEEALVAHSWPGNLRELRNVLECALLTGTETLIRRADLRLNRGGDNRSQAAAEPTADALKEIEWQHIRQVLADEAGSVARAAARLKIPRSTLYQKLKLQRGRLGSVAPDESEGRSGSRR
jgi:DNA-binding NtrC family response regulator